MEFAEVVIETQVSLALPKLDEVLIMPVGDTQTGVPAADTDKFRRYIEWGLEHDAFFIHMGDAVDMSSPSNRAKLRAIDFYEPENLALLKKAEDDVEEQYDILKDTQGRWLGWLRGHHYTDFGGGDTTDIRLSEMLGAPFLGDTGLVRINYTKDGWTSPVTTDIFAYHGSGAGKRIAAPLNALEQVASWFDADIYLTGHHHKLVSGKIDHLFVDKEGTLRHKTKTLACTGSFLRGYMQGSTDPKSRLAAGTYVEQAKLPPVALGGIKLRIRPVTDGWARSDVSVDL